MNYPYASGNIKALESKVLDRNKLFVLKDLDEVEFIKVLQSMNYGANEGTLEGLIASELQVTKELVDSLSPSKKDTDLFFLSNDSQNFKILYKIKKFDLDKYDLLENIGSLDCNELKDGIINNNTDELNKNQKKLIEKLNGELENIGSSKVLSFIIDKNLYEYALKQTNNHTLTFYLQSRIDITNVISMIRAQRLNWSLCDYLESFIPGGKIEKGIIEEAYDKGNEYFAKLVEPFYQEGIKKVLIEVFNKNDFSRVEIEFERLELQLMSDYKNDTFDIGPMLYYYLLKKAEAQNIRSLYSKKFKELKDLI